MQHIEPLSSKGYYEKLTKGNSFLNFNVYVIHVKALTEINLKTSYKWLKTQCLLYIISCN